MSKKIGQDQYVHKRCGKLRITKGLQQSDEIDNLRDNKSLREGLLVQFSLAKEQIDRAEQQRDRGQKQVSLGFSSSEG